MARARLIGINHVALEVDDLEAAVEFYGRAFEFELVREPDYRMAFLEMGDQFLALAEGRHGPRDESRHFGLVVDDLEVARQALADAGAEIVPGRGLNVRDPWGNYIQIVEYGRIQFSKLPRVLEGMGIGELPKSEAALAELREKGLAD